MTKEEALRILEPYRFKTVQQLRGIDRVYVALKTLKQDFHWDADDFWQVKSFLRRFAFNKSPRAGR